MAIFRFLNRHPLAGKRRWRAYRNFLSWQLRQRINPGPKIYTLVEDSRFWVTKGMRGATGNLYCGLLEFEEMAFTLHLLRPGDLMGDIGANVGVYTILSAKNAGASVIAVEPGILDFEYLQKNCVLNNISKQVSLYNKGAGSSERETAFVTGMDAANHVAISVELQNPGNISNISLVPLDVIFENRIPQLLKIDVEGFE